MQKKLLLLVLFLCTALPVFGQLTPIQNEKLATLLEKRINALRTDLGKTPLKRDISLAKAAQLHSDYMAKKGILSHKEQVKGFETPYDRVSHFNTDFGTIGENVLYSKPTRGVLNDKVLEKLAFEMFRAWKDSPGHYANMISSEYSYGDFGFTYDPKSKRIYATQVFGSEVIKIPGQFSPNAFGILKNDSKCNNLLYNKKNLIADLGNQISIVGNAIYFKYYSIHGLKKIISEEKDGLAIDIVLNSQLACGKPNELDSSPIHDGVMLAPIYRDALFAANEAEGDFRFIAKIGSIPESFVGKEFSLNLIFIKEGLKCSYNTPVSIPQKEYNLKSIEPILFRPKRQLVTEGIKEVTEVLFNFESGKVIPINQPKLNPNTSVYSIEINSYTSVDGPLKTNIHLQNERAAYIKDYVTKKLKTPNGKIVIQAKENWDLFDYQLEIRGLEDVRVLSKPEIKKYLLKNGNDWETELQEQRRSKAILYENGTWSSDSPLAPRYNLTHALIVNDNDLINLALAKIYDDTIFYDLLEQDPIFDRFLTNDKIVQNVAALLIKNIHFYELDKVTYFVRNWLLKADLLTQDAQKNLLNLYAITSKKMLRNWDTNSTDLSKVLHPKKVQPLFEHYKSGETVNPLFLNYHMSCLYYYGRTNEDQGIHESFTFVTNYYRKASLTLEDDIALALFFNSWSVYPYTIDLLEKEYRKKKYNEESLFILAQTINAYPYGMDKDDMLNVFKKAISMNKKRWCEWMKKDIQNLRDTKIKNLYCKTCN